MILRHRPLVLSLEICGHIINLFCKNEAWGRGVVVDVVQLVEQSRLTPEVRGSNPVIGKNLCKMYLLLPVDDEKRHGMAHFANKMKHILSETFNLFRIWGIPPSKFAQYVEVPTDTHFCRHNLSIC